MDTTTIRVDVSTHARLLEMSKENDRSLIETVRDAAEALRRQRFGQRVSEELANLKSDPVAWADYLGEADSTSVADGLG
jgi:hypothetical protein